MCLSVLYRSVNVLKSCDLSERNIESGSCQLPPSQFFTVPSQFYAPKLLTTGTEVLYNKGEQFKGPHEHLRRANAANSCHSRF